MILYIATKTAQKYQKQGITKQAILLFASAIFLSGCAVGPNFEKPQFDAPVSWLADDQKHFFSESQDHKDWWKNFSDPVLNNLVDRALAENQSLEIAGLRIYEGRSQLGLALGTLLPQGVSINAGANRTELSENAEPISYLPPLTQVGVDSEFSNHRLGFSAAWELDFWGRFRRIVEAAEASFAARIAAYDAATVTLTSEVASSYILLRTIEQRLAVARTNLVLRERSQTISSVRVRNELTSELDLVQASVQVKNNQSLIPRLETALRHVENALGLLIGSAPGEVRKIIGDPADIPVTPRSVAVGIPADLIRRRPDIRQAEYMAAVQSAAIGITKAELYPSFSIAGTVGYSSGDLSDLSDVASRESLLGAGFRWNIFNFGRIKNRIRASDARFQQALEAYEIVVLNALREADGAQVAFINSSSEVEALKQAAEQARRAVELANIQYSDGLVDFNRVLFAQQVLLRQEGLLVDARGRVARNLIAIYRSLGGGWQQRSNDSLISEDSKTQMLERTDWGDQLSTPVLQQVETP